MNKKEKILEIINKIYSCKNVLELEKTEKEFLEFSYKINLDKNTELFKKIKNLIDLMSIKIKKNFNMREQRIVRLKESDLHKIIKRIMESEEEPTDDDIEDVPVDDIDSEDEDIMDYGFDYEDDSDVDDDKFQSKMRFKNWEKKNKLGSVGIGSSTRWDKDSEKPYSPIKPDDLPLDKFLEKRKLKNK